MSEEIGYNVSKAIAYIRSSYPKESLCDCTNNVILCIIEHIWDWYETRGLLTVEVDDEEEDDFNIQEIVDYIVNLNVKRKEFDISRNTVELIVKGELEYEKSIDTFI